MNENVWNENQSLQPWYFSKEPTSDPRYQLRTIQTCRFCFKWELKIILNLFQYWHIIWPIVLLLSILYTYRQDTENTHYISDLYVNQCDCTWGSTLNKKNCILRPRALKWWWSKRPNQSKRADKMSQKEINAIKVFLSEEELQKS